MTGSLFAPRCFFVTVELCLVATAGAVLAVEPAPFSCEHGSFMVQDVDSAIFHGDDFDPICTGLGMEINNLGYRSTDGSLIAIKLTPAGNEGIIQVRSDCLPQMLGSPPGLPIDERFDAGGISPDGSTMYVHAGGSGRLYVVALDPSPPVLIDSVDFPTTGNVHDWAQDPSSDPANPELVGATTTGHISRLAVWTGTRTDSETAILPAGVAYGGARFDHAGRLVAYRNSGEIFVIDVSDATAPTIVDNTGFGRASTRGDATSCPVQSCDAAYIMQGVGAALFQTESSNLGFGSPVEICSLGPNSGNSPLNWDRLNSLEPLPPTLELNNMCFRQQDRRIYALELHPDGNHGLVRFDPRTCLLESLGPVTNLPTTDRFDGGDCWDERLLVSVGGLPNSFYLLDLRNLTAEPVTIQKKHPNSNFTGLVHDWAYNPRDGRLYGGDSTQGQLAILELHPGGTVLGLREDRNLVNWALPASIAFGGAWFNANGNLVLHRNQTGELFEIDVEARMIVDTGSTSLDSGFSDGASCFLDSGQ